MCVCVCASMCVVRCSSHTRCCASFSWCYAGFYCLFVVVFFPTGLLVSFPLAWSIICIVCVLPVWRGLRGEEATEILSNHCETLCDNNSKKSSANNDDNGISYLSEMVSTHLFTRILRARLPCFCLFRSSFSHFMGCISFTPCL